MKYLPNKVILLQGLSSYVSYKVALPESLAENQSVEQWSLTLWPIGTLEMNRQDFDYAVGTVSDFPEHEANVSPQPPPGAKCRRAPAADLEAAAVSWQRRSARG